jgi:S1-C subfamily serine protease
MILEPLILPLLIFAVTIPEQIHQTEDERNTIAVFSKAKLGVVHIKARQQESTEFGVHQHSESTGSGFLIDHHGHILTNYHVIESANRIEVYLPDGGMAVARLIGTAPTLDVAILRVDLYEAGAHEPLQLGDSEGVVIGQKVIAVGHPLALHNTLTIGVVSAVRRSLPGVPAELQGSLLQTDAAINPGNSGGPLLNSSGDVIGIATALIPEAQNLGFAVPIHLVKRVLPDLISMGHPYRPSLGIDGVEITPEIADLFGLPQRKGLLVERVAPGSLAERAGILAGSRMVLLNETVYVLGGDIVTVINGEDVSSESQIAKILLLSRPGETLTVRLVREGQVQEVELPLEAMHSR